MTKGTPPIFWKQSPQISSSFGFRESLLGSRDVCIAEADVQRDENCARVVRDVESLSAGSYRSSSLSVESAGDAPDAAPTISQLLLQSEELNSAQTRGASRSRAALRALSPGRRVRPAGVDGCGRSLVCVELSDCRRRGCVHRFSCRVYLRSVLGSCHHR